MCKLLALQVGFFQNGIIRCRFRSYILNAKRYTDGGEPIPLNCGFKLNLTSLFRVVEKLTFLTRSVKVA